MEEKGHCRRIKRNNARILTVGSQQAVPEPPNDPDRKCARHQTQKAELHYELTQQ
jgi:hypothetical protein